MIPKENFSIQCDVLLSDNIVSLTVTDIEYGGVYVSCGVSERDCVMIHRSCCLKKGVIPSLSSGSGSAWWNVDDPSRLTKCCNIVTLLGLMPFLLSSTLLMGILKLGIAY